MGSDVFSPVHPCISCRQCTRDQDYHAVLAAVGCGKSELNKEDVLLTPQLLQAPISKLILLHTSLTGEVTELKQLRKNDQSPQKQPFSTGSFNRA